MSSSKCKSRYSNETYSQNSYAENIELPTNAVEKGINKAIVALSFPKN